MNVIWSLTDTHLVFNKVILDLLNKPETNKSSLQKLCNAIESEEEMNCRTPETFVKTEILRILNV
jgi:hypothetical protein